MQQPQHSPTPALDQIRPRVLRALHVRGWHRDDRRDLWPEAVQVGRRCVVRGSRDGMRLTLELVEGDDGVVTYVPSGSGGPSAVRDLLAEEVLG